MQLATLFNDLDHNKFDNIYLIEGSSSYLTKKIKNKFINLIPQSERSTNCVSFNMESTPLTHLLADLQSIPFLGKYHLTMISNPYFLTSKRDKFLTKTVKDSRKHKSRDQKHFIKYLKNPVPSTILVIFAPYNKLDRRRKLNKILLKQAQVIDLNTLSAGNIEQYIGNYISDHGYRINNNDLTILINRTNGDLSKLMVDLSKLFIYCNQNKIIDFRSIKALVPKSLDQNVFDLVNEVMNSNSGKALKLYHDLLIEGNQPLQLHALLVSQFRTMLQTKILADQGSNQWTIGKILRQNPYRIKYILRDIQGFSVDQLANAYSALFNNERALKSGNKSPMLLLSLFMVRYNN